MTVQTTRLLTTRRAALADWLRRQDLWGATAIAVVLVAVLAGAWQARPAAQARPVATLAPVLVLVTPRPTEQPIAVQVAVLRLPRAVVAYAAPGGAVLGAIDSGKPYTIVARSGPDWTQLRIAESGDVWVRRSDLEGDVPDIATPEPPPLAQEIVVFAAPATPDLPLPTATPESPFGSKPNRRNAR